MKTIILQVIDMVRKLWYILTRRQKIYGILVLIGCFGGALLETMGVSAIIPMVTALIATDDLMEKKWIQAISSVVEIDNTVRLTMFIGIGIILIYIIKNIYFILLSWAKVRYSSKVQRELAVRMIDEYMKKGYSYFLNHNTSELMRGVSVDTSGTYNLLNNLFHLCVNGLTILFICIYICVTDIYMAVGIVFLALICLVAILFLSKRKMKVMGVQSRKYVAIANQHLLQAFQGIKEVLVLNKQEYFSKNYEKALKKQQEANISFTVASECPAYLIEAICISGLLGIVFFRVGIMKEDAVVMLPALSSFAVGAFRILPALGQISSEVNTILFQMESLNAMYRHLHDIEQKENYFYTQNDSNDSLCFRDKIKVNNVSWRYSHEGALILREVCLDILRGTTIAFIGQSGAGKTTLADIILGLLKPEKGDVTLDGISIFSNLTDWSKHIGYVPQSVYIVDGSIRQNVAFGIEERNIDDEKIWKALEEAQLSEFVKGLANGLETNIGERGVRFSGGQRQRIAIARALYHEPEILVLDEATAALDTETETAVMEAINALKGKMTMIIIAHRLTTIKNCDIVYEVIDGRVVERDKMDVLKGKV